MAIANRGIVINLLYIRVPNLPGKCGILLFTFTGLENAGNLLKKWEIPGILTQNIGKKLNFENFMFPNKLCKMSLQIKSFTSMLYLNLSTPTL